MLYFNFDSNWQKYVKNLKQDFCEFYKEDFIIQLKPYVGLEFTFGAGLALAKIKFIPETYFQQEISAKFSSPPKIPEGFEKWKSGFYLNFGIAVKIFENT